MNNSLPADRRAWRTVLRTAFFALLVLSAAAPLSAQEPPARTPMVAVTALQARGVAESDAAVLTETLADVLLRSGKVRVMERSQMDKILAEQGFQQAGACDTAECAVQMGRLLGIERIIVGSVGKVGETYSLSVRMVDVGTGEVLASSRRNHRGAIDDVLERVVPEVGRELIGAGETRDAGAPAPEAGEPKSSRAWLWWTLGGVAVVGGGAAAVVILAGDDAASTPAPDVPTDTSVPVRVTLP